jgi:hypothetical protein
MPRKPLIDRDSSRIAAAKAERSQRDCKRGSPSSCGYGRRCARAARWYLGCNPCALGTSKKKRRQRRKSSTTSFLVAATEGSSGSGQTRRRCVAIITVRRQRRSMKDSAAAGGYPFVFTGGRVTRTVGCPNIFAQPDLELPLLRLDMTKK